MAVTRRLAAMGAALVAVLAAGLAPAATASAAHPDSWASLRVPHLALATAHGHRYPRSVQLGRNRLRYPRWGVSSMAATADAAIVQAETSQVELGTLLELPARGRAGRVLERSPLGIPIADPGGHVAFWSHRTGPASRLVAYDTASRTKVIGPKVEKGTRVFAVDGDTAYLYPAVGDPESWRLGDPAVVEHPELGGERLLTDVHGGRVLFTDSDGLSLTDLAGTSLGTVPGAGYATFSPDGSTFVAHTRRGYRVYDSNTLQLLPLRGLHGREAYQARWTPAGRLVLSLVKSRSHPLNVATPVRFAACSLPDGRCQGLAGRSNSFLEPGYESTAFDQLLLVLGD
jgi:hypothetical protein